MVLGQFLYRVLIVTQVLPWLLSLEGGSRAYCYKPEAGHGCELCPGRSVSVRLGQPIPLVFFAAESNWLG